jgi:hypothetical protein
MKNSTKILLFIALVVVLASCAVPVHIDTCVAGARVYGFWNGLWHGMTAGISFIGSLINPEKYVVYAVNNNGGWYNFGFLLGVGGALGSGGVSFRGSRRKR